MICFRNDYSIGCHPRMLQALTESNMVHCDGYGEDQFCHNASELIKKTIGNNKVDVHFIPIGTQCNVIGLSSFIRPFHAIISPSTSHVQVHETGAIEASGHKIYLTESNDGKLYPDDIIKIMEKHEDEHMAMPKLVSIAFPTEIGTIYSKEEIKNIRKVCDKYNLLFYIDGARMAQGLASSKNDLDLNFISEHVDAFYIGGTKNGAMMGEAFVICNPALTEDFRYLIKMRGALLAKGRLMGVQFEEFFKDGLYFELGKQATEMGELLTKELKDLNLEFLVDSPTNQVFPILPLPVIEELEKDFFFYRWSKEGDDKWSVRFVTSWATKKDEVLALVSALKKLMT